MKKIFLLFTFLIIKNCIALDQIGQAIKQSNSKLVAELLAQKGKLTESEKLQYLDLAH